MSAPHFAGYIRRIGARPDVLLEGFEEVSVVFDVERPLGSSLRWESALDKILERLPRKKESVE